MKKYLYKQIYDDIKARIDNNEIEAGEKLPSEKELQNKYDASRDTIRKALGWLEFEDYLDRKPGKGTFVREKKIDYDFSRIDSFSEQMNRLGRKASSNIVSLDLSTNMPEHIKEILQIPDNGLCYKVSRIRLADGKIMAYEETYIPYECTPNLHEHLTNESSLYKIYEEVYKIKMGVGQLSVEAQLTDKEIQELLNIKPSEPVLKMEGCVTQADYKPLYYVDCWYRADRYKFTIQLQR